MMLLHTLILSLGVFCLFLGQGRTAIIALFLASASTIPIVFLQSWNKQLKSKILLFSFLLISVGAGSFYILDFKNFSGLVELEEIFRKGNYSALLYAGGRTGIYQASFDFLSRHWLFGMGQGYFFNKAGYGFELHSVIPDWILGVGVPILCLSFFPFFYRLLFLIRNTYQSKDLSKKIVLAGLIYIFLSTVPDVYFSFRSLLVVSLAFLLFVDHSDLKPISWRTYATLFMLVVGLGGASFASPHFRPLVFKTYPEEVQAMTPNLPVTTERKVEFIDTPLSNFSWTSIGTRLTVGPECLGFLFNSPFQQTGHKIAFRSGLERDIHPDINYEKAKKLFKMASEIELGVGATLWRSICFCNSSEETKFVDLLSSRGNYINFSKSLNTPPDRRYVGFKISAFKPNLDPNSSEVGEKLLPIACERINI
jgi:hypothetical protein